MSTQANHLGFFLPKGTRQGSVRTAQALTMTLVRLSFLEADGTGLPGTFVATPQDEFISGDSVYPQTPVAIELNDGVGMVNLAPSVIPYVCKYYSPGTNWGTGETKLVWTGQATVPESTEPIELSEIVNLSSVIDLVDTSAPVSIQAVLDSPELQNLISSLGGYDGFSFVAPLSNNAGVIGLPNATQANSGALSAADKIKLDNLGSTYQVKSQVLDQWIAWATSAQPGDVPMRTANGFATAEIVESTDFTYTPVNRSGTTSPTPNTITQVMAANPNRKKWTIQNISDTDIVVMIGATGQEADFLRLTPGSVVSEAKKDAGIFTQRIAVRSPGASKAYLATEGV